MYQVAMQLDLISHWLYPGLYLLCKVGCELFSLRLASGTGDKAGWGGPALPSRIIFGVSDLRRSPSSDFNHKQFHGIALP